MRVVLATYGSRGDVEPIVALALELRIRGAHVTVCVPPDDEFVALVRRIDIDPVTFPKSWRSWAGDKTTAVEQVISVDDYVRGYIDATFPTLLNVAKGCDLIVASGMLHFIGQSVAELASVAYIFVVFAPNLLAIQKWQEPALAPLNAHRSSLALGEVGDVREFLFTRRPWLAADRFLAQADDLMGFTGVQTDAWMLADDRPLPKAVEAFLDAGTPPVYVGFGSMRVRPQSARTAIDAIRAHGCRAIIAKGWSDLNAAEGSEDCFTIGEVNQQALFRRVATVIHHGGAGTTFAAARAGAPQIVIPQSAADQLFWAERVSALRIGVAHDGSIPTFSSLSGALSTALSSKVRDEAFRVSARLGGDGAAEAAQLITQSI